MTQPCVFCGEEKPLTKEHVYPRNWKQFFPELSSRDPIWRVGRSGFTANAGATHQFDNLVRDVCGECNAGWMRQIDEEARDIVLAVALGKSEEIPEDAINIFRVWATKTSLIRTLQDKADAQQAASNLFRDFHRTREPPAGRLIQIGVCAPNHLDSNHSWTTPGASSAKVNVVSIAMGSLFVQTALVDESDVDAFEIAGDMLAAVRRFAPNQITPVRVGRTFRAGGRLSSTQVSMAREVHAITGVAPAIEESIIRVPGNELPGASFGNVHREPVLNSLSWQRMDR